MMDDNTNSVNCSNIIINNNNNIDRDNIIINIDRDG